MDVVEMFANDGDVEMSGEIEFRSDSSEEEVRKAMTLMFFTGTEGLVEADIKAFNQIFHLEVIE